MPHERLLILEDTAEIQCSAPNHVFKRQPPKSACNCCCAPRLRYRPDRIFVGEVRGGECLDLLKAWNTGHPGGVATVHANDAKGGLIRLENLVAEITAAPMQKTIAAAIDFIVFIAKTSVGIEVRPRQIATSFFASSITMAADYITATRGVSLIENSTQLRFASLLEVPRAGLAFALTSSFFTRSSMGSPPPAAAACPGRPRCRPSSRASPAPSPTPSR